MIILIVLCLFAIGAWIWDANDIGTRLKFNTKWRARELTPAEIAKHNGKKVICERTGYIYRNDWRPIQVTYGCLFNFIDDSYDLVCQVTFHTMEEAEEWLKNCREVGRFYSPYKFVTNV